MNGVTNVSIQTIEKEFGLSSKISGFIVTGNDVSAILLVSGVSFFGAKGNKPKWIGIGSIITGMQNRDFTDIPIIVTLRLIIKYFAKASVI